MDKLIGALSAFANKPGVRMVRSVALNAFLPFHPFFLQAEHVLAIGALFYLARKLRKTKLTQLLSAVPGSFSANLPLSSGDG